MLEYVVAKEDICFTNKKHIRFATKGKRYNVLWANREEFEILDDLTIYHTFSFGDCNYFELHYKEN